EDRHCPARRSRRLRAPARCPALRRVRRALFPATSLPASLPIPTASSSRRSRRNIGGCNRNQGQQETCHIRGGGFEKRPISMRAIRIGACGWRDASDRPASRSDKPVGTGKESYRAVGLAGAFPGMSRGIRHTIPRLSETKQTFLFRDTRIVSEKRKVRLFQ